MPDVIKKTHCINMIIKQNQIRNYSKTINQCWYVGGFAPMSYCVQLESFSAILFATCSFTEEVTKIKIYSTIFFLIFFSFVPSGNLHGCEVTQMRKC